jgi:hypothetical protein
MILDILIGLAALAIAVPFIVAVGVVILIGMRYLMVTSALRKKKTK